MIKIELKTIVKALQDFQSLEIDHEGRAWYWLHLTDDGRPVPDQGQAAYSYKAERDISGYVEDLTTDRIDKIYSSEALGDPTFSTMLDDLCREIEAGGQFSVDRGGAK